MLLWTSVQDDVPAMGRQLRSLSVPFRDDVDERRFDKDFERRTSRYGRGSGADVKSVISASISVLRDNGYRLDPQLTLALKSMMQASAFFTPLAPPDRPFTTAALDATKELAQQTLTGDVVLDAAKREGARLLGDGIQAVPEYLRGLLSWQDQLKRGKLTVYVDTSSLDRQMSVVRSLTSMVVISVLLAGALVGSALASQVFSDAADERLRVASQIGFFGSLAVAAVLVVVLLVRLVRRRD